MNIVWNDAKLARLAGAILKRLRVHGATVDIFLLGNREMTALKARFFKKLTEPNVLSFPEPEGFPHPELGRRQGAKPRHLGEIYLNRDILRRSPERAEPLLLHGILHLLGYDHIKKADAAVMEALEDKMLKRF